MLTLTDAAGAHLAVILADKECADDIAVRLVCRKTRKSLVLDNSKDGDSTFKHEGRTVLLLSQKVVDLLDGKTIDVRQTNTGGRLCFAKRARTETETRN